MHLLRAQNFPTEPGATRPNIQGAPEARWGCRDYDRSGAIWGSGSGLSSLGGPKGGLDFCILEKRGLFCFQVADIVSETWPESCPLRNRPLATSPSQRHRFSGEQHVRLWELLQLPSLWATGRGAWGSSCSWGAGGRGLQPPTDRPPSTDR